MPKENKKESVSPFALIAGALVIIAVITFAFLSKKESEETPAPEVATQQPADPQPAPAEQPKSTQDFRMPPFVENVEAAVLKPTLDPMTVAPGAQAAYVVAQKKPRLLAQLPCFCYCDRFGHGSLHDCFVTDHAQSCDICMKEALRADELDQQGTPASAIREVIVTQFHPVEHTH